MREIQKGKICWTCRHGQFSKRQGDLVGRGRGWCLYDAGERPYPKGWRPPAPFWNDLIDHAFADTYEEFLTTNAIIYYGHAAKMDARTGGNLHGSDRFRQEYEYMRWLQRNEDDLLSISWQDTCDQHES